MRSWETRQYTEKLHMSNEIEVLRGIVADESLGITARKDAAEHVVRLKVDAVPDALATDPEVIALQQPYPRATEFQRRMADLCVDMTRGRSINGFSAREALIAVRIRHQNRMLKALAEDETEHALIRDAARACWIPFFDVSSPNLE